MHSETAKELVDLKAVKIDNLHDLLFQSSSKMKTNTNLKKHVTIGKEGHLNVLEDSSLFKVSSIREEDEVDFSKLKINKQFKLVSSLPKLKSVPATP